MNFVSTRGASAVTFDDALLNGIAADGGLFFPEVLPQFHTDDFADAHYVFWRNSENPDFVFLELFYAPFFLAFSVGIFFLICLEYKFTRQTSIILSFVLVGLDCSANTLT